MIKQKDRQKDMSNTTNTRDGQSKDNTRGDMGGFVSQFYVFSGETYLGWDCFDSPSVKVGGSAFADLVLDDPDLDDIQAEFVIRNGRITVINLGKNGGLTVNNRVVSDSSVGAFDVVKIGKYTVKAKLKKMTGASMDQPRMDNPVILEEITPAMAEKMVREEPLPAKDIQLEKTDKAENPPAIVRELLTIMDDYEDLEFDDIEEILTARAEGKHPGSPVTGKMEQSCAVSSHDSAVKPISGLMTDLGAQTAIIERPAPYDLVAEKREGRPCIPEKNENVVSSLHQRASNLTRKEISAPGKSEITLPGTPVRRKSERAVKADTVEPDSLPQGVDSETVQEKKAEAGKSLKIEKTDLPFKEMCSFPAGFYSRVEEDDEEEEDIPANFTLREKLVGETASAKSHDGEKVLEVIKFRGGNVITVAHVKDGNEHMLVQGKETFCRLVHSESHGTKILFTKKLLGTINRAEGREFKPVMEPGRKLSGSKNPVYSSLLPVKGELTLSDGFYDYVVRESVLPADAETHDDLPAIPVHQKVLKSTAFKYGSRAFIFHFILLVVLSFSVRMPDKSEFKNPETFFVKVETEDIKRPVKPIPKPRPVLPAPVKTLDNPVKKEFAKKEELKETVKTAAREEAGPRATSSNRTETPDTAAGKAGNVTNRNVNNVGLLATLGKKTGISLSPNEALAGVSTIDAVTSTRGHEANVKVGNIVSGMGDGRIAISSGKAINNKGGAGVYRSAGIGGKGSVAALSAGKAGKRSVKAVVAAPVAKKVRASGGGISREAVAKVINDHMDEINGCYESALVNDPSLMGRVEFEWTILQSGHVGDVKIKSSTVKSSQIHSCIISSIKSWKFPQPQGADVVVSYPFVFDVTGF